jgi:hypothetical protein
VGAMSGNSLRFRDPKSEGKIGITYRSNWAVGSGSVSDDKIGMTEVTVTCGQPLVSLKLAWLSFQIHWNTLVTAVTA